MVLFGVVLVVVGGLLLIWAVVLRQRDKKRSQSAPRILATVDSTPSELVSAGEGTVRRHYAYVRVNGETQKVQIPRNIFNQLAPGDQLSLVRHPKDPTRLRHPGFPRFSFFFLLAFGALFLVIGLLVLSNG